MENIFVTILGIAFLITLSRAQPGFLRHSASTCPKMLQPRSCQYRGVNYMPWARFLCEKRCRHKGCCFDGCTYRCLPKPADPIRCPRIKPDDVGICVTMPCSSCSSGTICCPNACGGTVCIPEKPRPDICDNFLCEATPGATCRKQCFLYRCRRVVYANGVRISHDCDCPKDMPVAQCFDDPCRPGGVELTCESNPQSICVPFYCGGCNVKFYDPFNGADVTDECFPDK